MWAHLVWAFFSSSSKTNAYYADRVTFKGGYVDGKMNIESVYLQRDLFMLQWIKPLRPRSPWAAERTNAPRGHLRLYQQYKHQYSAPLFLFWCQVSHTYLLVRQTLCWAAGLRAFSYGAAVQTQYILFQPICYLLKHNAAIKREKNLSRKMILIFHWKFLDLGGLTDTLITQLNGIKVRKLFWWAPLWGISRHPTHIRGGGPRGDSVYLDNPQRGINKWNKKHS